MFSTGKLQADGATVVAIFAGVIQQDRQKLSERAGVTIHTHSRRDLAGERESALLSEGGEGFCRFRSEGAEIDRLKGSAAGALVHAREGDKMVDKLGHARCFAANIVEPRAWALLILDDVEIGADESQWRFELVTGVGDELLLPLDAFGDWSHGALGEQRHQQQNDQTAAGEHRCHGVEQTIRRRQFAVGADEDRQCVAVVRFGQKIAKAVAPAARVAVSQRGFCEGSSVLAFDARDRAGVDSGHCAVGVEAHREKACGERRFLCDADRRTSWSLGETVVAGKAAVVFCDDIRQIVEGVRCLQAGEREDRAKEHNEHREK